MGAAIGGLLAPGTPESLFRADGWVRRRALLRISRRLVGHPDPAETHSRLGFEPESLYP